MTKAQPAAPASNDRVARAHARLGWTMLAMSFTFGLLVEGLLGFRAEVINDPLRDELWTLGHFHAAFLGLLNLLYPLVTGRVPLAEESKRRRSLALMIGSVLLPLGFILGGVAHPEGDPGVGIWLAPMGAVALVTVAVAHAVDSWRA